jgi:hypothetical protein
MWRLACLIDLLSMPLPAALSTVCGWWLRWLLELWERLRPWRSWWSWLPALSI